MKDLLLVFIGGGTGSVCRFIISRNLHQFAPLPLGTFLVNVTGSFLIGLFLGLSLKQQLLSPGHTLLLSTGFTGGFTTFSAFAYENQVFLKSGDYLHFGIYTISSLALGFIAVFGGLYLAKMI